MDPLAPARAQPGGFIRRAGIQPSATDSPRTIPSKPQRADPPVSASARARLARTQRSSGVSVLLVTKGPGISRAARGIPHLSAGSRGSGAG